MALCHMLHISGLFELMQKIEVFVEDFELIWILEKINVFLDISYNILKAPRHSIQSGKKSSSVRVNL